LKSLKGGSAMESEQQEQVGDEFSPEQGPVDDRPRPEQGDLLFVEDELTVTGPEPQVVRILEKFSEGLTLKDRRQLGFDSELIECMAKHVPQLEDCAKVSAPWLMDLYRITDGRPARKWIRDVRNLDPCLFADLNYLIGYRHTVAGSGRTTKPGGGEVTPDRHTVAGSGGGEVGALRYTVAGSGGYLDPDVYTVAGSPYTVRGRQVDAPSFWSQWAFQRIGLVNGEERQAARAREGVEVAIFDTSPFRNPGTQLLEWIAADLSATNFELMVEPVSTPNPPPNPFAIPLPDLRDHGLAVAGLVHAVAPESNIHLFRVLDDQARGPLFGLVVAMRQFIEKMRHRQYEHSDGVINLSLGVHGPSGRGRNSVTLLEIMLAYAHCLGLVVVAAAGNDSWGKPSPLEAQIPAAYDYVVGAQASSVGGARACFSNKGDAGAPGCGVISLAYEPPPTVGYRYWTGTSFAAPLISGLAARLLDELPGQPSPAQVRQEIENRSKPSSDSTLPKGIISLGG
jgi:hypothetical protein